MSIFSEGLTDVFFPVGIKCIVCDDDIPEGSRFPLCKSCRLLSNNTFCLCCGRHTAVASQYCSGCKAKSWNFTKARAPFVYKDDVKQVIYKFKYGNGKYIAKEIAVYLADAYYEHDLKSDIITFVPMFFKKHKQRGYNQAEELARELGKILGCDVLALLRKKAMTVSNASQNARQRADAVKDKFEIDSAKNELIDIAGKKILLIDDVFTTGATVNECARVLMSAHAAEVKVLTFATAIQSDAPRENKKSLKDIPTLD